MNIAHNCDDQAIPYIAMDTGDEDNQSTRLVKPVMPNLITSLQQQSSVNEATTIQADVASGLSAAGLSVRQSLSRSNQTLKQIREASAEVQTTESQLSYKPLTPQAPPLPNGLGLTRSKPL